MSDQPARRDLKFGSFDEVIDDIENLRAKGYDKAGKWNLAQICRHLAEWMRFAIDGYPRNGCVIGSILWLAKITIGKKALRNAIRTNKMPPGGPTNPSTVSPPESDETAAVDKLKGVIARFRVHTGECHPSPLYGSWTRDECLRLNLVHAAHHLSFLVPKQ